MGRRAVRQAISLTWMLPLILAFNHATAGDKFDADFRLGWQAEYTDNLFRLAEDEKDDFEDNQAPGERYFDMADVQDVVNRLRLDAGLSWRIAKKRSFDLDFRTAYYDHLDNDVADYLRLDAEIGYDATRADRFYAGLDRSVDRFRRNYSVTGTGTFAPGVFDQSLFRVGYRRDLGKRSEFGIEIRDLDRSYDAPFSGRDRDGPSVEATFKYRLSKRVTARTSAGVGQIDVELDTAGAVPIDRSFDEAFAEQRFNVNLRKKQELDVVLQYRDRDYTTNETADLGRFERNDVRLRARIQYDKRLSKRLNLHLRTEWTDSDSDRIDPSVNTDEVGYREVSAGVGLAYRF